MKNKTATSAKNIAFVGGVAILLLNGTLETLSHYGYHYGTRCPEIVAKGSFPIGLLFICTLLIAPYMIGVAAAGKVWAALPSLLLRPFRGRRGTDTVETWDPKTSGRDPEDGAL